jgi:DNA-binding response OmpR family regulator
MSNSIEINVPFIPFVSRRTVLVIDDDLDIQKLLSRAVERAGHHAVCTVDGHEGLRRFEELAPAMVLLDLMLPNLSGFEICRRMRALGSTIPMIAISTRDLPEDEAHALACGFDLFICKPVRLDDVSQTVAWFLEQPATRGDGT